MRHPRSANLMTDSQDAKQQYGILRPLYEAFAARVASLVGELLTTSHISHSQVEHRAKTTDSVAEKVRRKGYTNPLSDIKDLAGVRVIVYYHDDVQRVAEMIRREFDVDPNHSSDKLEELSVDEFGYRSFHLVCRLNSARRSLAEWSKYRDLFVEIQVRSVLQHAWAAISHKIDYKAVSQAPAELRRALYRLSALLELADDQFATLRDSSSELVQRYQAQVVRGKLDIPLNIDSLTQYLHEKVDLDEWRRLGVEAGMDDPHEVAFKAPDVSKLLAVLQAVNVKTLAEFQQLLDKHRPGAAGHLRVFADEVRHEGRGFFAVPVDVISALVTIAERDRLPPGFEWTKPWREDIRRTVRRLISKTAPST